jgi:hypothetical protein
MSRFCTCSMVKFVIVELFQAKSLCSLGKAAKVVSKTALSSLPLLQKLNELRVSLACKYFLMLHGCSV